MALSFAHDPASFLASLIFAEGHGFARKIPLAVLNSD